MSRFCQEAVRRTALCRSGFCSHVRHDPSEIARPSSFFLYPPPFLFFFVLSRFFLRLSRRLPRLPASLPTAVSPQHWGLISSGILALHNGEEAWRCHRLHIYLLATCLLWNVAIERRIWSMCNRPADKSPRSSSCHRRKADLCSERKASGSTAARCLDNTLFAGKKAEATIPGIEIFPNRALSWPKLHNKGCTP